MNRSKMTAGYYAAFSLVESFLEMMKKQKITRSKLAELTGTTKPNVSKWFSPGRNLTIFTAASIADALGAELRISLVEKATGEVRDENLWGSGVLPASHERTRVTHDNGALRHATSEVGVSAAVQTPRFRLVTRDVRGAAELGT